MWVQAFQRNKLLRFCTQKMESADSAETSVLICRIYGVKFQNNPRVISLIIEERSSDLIEYIFALVIRMHDSMKFNQSFDNVQILPACLLNRCWPSPAQLFLVPSPTGLMTIFYYLEALGAYRTPLSASRFHSHALILSRYNCCRDSVNFAIRLLSPSGFLVLKLFAQPNFCSEPLKPSSNSCSCQCVSCRESSVEII
jgi:hypothetical protein